VDYRDAFKAYLRTGAVAPELRAAGEATGPAGGYLFPEEFHAELAVQLAEYGRVFADFTRVSTGNGRPLNAPVAQPATAGTLVSENPASALGTNDRAYSNVLLDAYTVTSGIGVFSFQVYEDSGFEVEGLVRDFAAESIGRVLSQLSTGGTGSSQPTGLYAGAASGQTVSLTAAKALEVDGAATTELTANGLTLTSYRALMKAVDPAYWKGAKWYLNGTQFETLLGTTDSSGQPVVRPNGPLTLWDFPIVVANEVSNLTASTVSGPVFGNLAKAYYFRDAGTSVLRLRERYADLAQVGFVAYQRADFQVRDSRAFAVVKPAAT
jgi:HK97 family phage major capsid protein